jgi:hypothetical protein
VKRLKEEYVPFLDRDGREIQRIRLSSEDVELKFWLSTALLQTSRQLRFEAMSILFKNRIITVEWLPVLPRFVEFLGKEGCDMVRYLDIWDTLNLQEVESDRYRDILMSILHFSHIQHLRIVLDVGLSYTGVRSNRTNSWLDVDEWTQDGKFKKHAVPKMRSEDIESHWPEYEVLKNMKIQKFTLAVETSRGNAYLEFDRTYGAFPGLSKSMQSHLPPRESASPAPVSTTSISPEAFEAFEAIEMQPRSRDGTPSSEIDDEDSDCHTWQDTDTLTNKTIPLYNFVREALHNDLRLPETRERPSRNFITFPVSNLYRINPRN